MTEYQPGACNIGRAEREKRRFVGYLGFLAAVLSLVAVAAADLPAVWVFASAVPFYAGFLGVLQARAGFCSGFGLAGVYDVSRGGEQRQEVADGEARTADRRRALVLQVEAAGLAVVAAGGAYGLALVIGG